VLETVPVVDVHIRSKSVGPLTLNRYIMSAFLHGDGL
jgi:hypothetical protein